MFLYVKQSNTNMNTKGFPSDFAGFSGVGRLLKCGYVRVGCGFVFDAMAHDPLALINLGRLNAFLRLSNHANETTACEIG